MFHVLDTLLSVLGALYHVASCDQATIMLVLQIKRKLERGGLLPQTSQLVIGKSVGTLKESRLQRTLLRF